MSSTLYLRKTRDTFARCANVFASKRSLARILSTFLCCTIVVIRPFSRLGGDYAFLALTLKELVFSVQASLAQQLELTVLNILGALLGIAVSTLAKFIASRYPENSATSRATCAVFLVLISFFAGLTKSRLPRLQLSTRISCFVSVWILTNDIGDRFNVLTSSGNFLWVTLSAAIVCIFSLVLIMSLLHWSSTNFERDIAAALTVIHRSLEVGLSLAFPHPGEPPIDKDECERLKKELLRRSISLNENYSQAAFELRIGRLSLKSIRPLVGIVEHLRRELAWGMPIHKTEHQSRHVHVNVRHPPGFVNSTVTSPLPSPPLPVRNILSETIEMPARELGDALLCAMRSVERTIALAFNQSDPPARLFSWTVPQSSQQSPNNPPSLRDRRKGYEGWTYSQLPILRDAEIALVTARDHATEALRQVFLETKIHQGGVDAESRLSQEVRNCSLAMIALLQMAHEVRIALQITQRFTNRYESSRSRLWYPRFSLAWLGVPPGPFVSDDPNAQFTTWNNSNDGLAPADTDFAAQEWKQGLKEQVYRLDVRRSAANTAIIRTSRRGMPADVGVDAWWRSGFRHYLARIWTRRKTVRLRIQLWRFLQAVRHSNHLRHAAKAAFGVALLTFPAFLPIDSSGYRWYSFVHGQWITISYLWVLETNTGATWRTGYLRILGTACGALYAYITWLICKTNPYAIVIMITLADLPITWLITQTNLGPFATPASVALPPIVLARYVLGSSTGPVITLTLLRAGMITLGMVAALLMNSLVFPRHSRVYFLSDTSRTFGFLTDLYLALSHEIFHDKPSWSRDGRRRALKLELEIRNALHRMSALIVTMHSEFGLLPKPLRHYRRIVALMQNMLDLMIGLRKIRENIPRKITVAEVFKERREFMSCICIALYACQHAFKAREPLPQFLPSARHALEILESHVQERIRHVQDDNLHTMGLSLVNAFAEQEVLRNMVDTIEALLECTGGLFGTSAWLTHDSHWSKSTLHNEENIGDHGWYSTIRLEDI